jgi:hypothetical protein
LSLETLFGIFLIALSGYLLGVLVETLVVYIKLQISIIKNNKEFYRKIKEKDSSIKKWVTVTGPDGKKLMVDENSGWCPDRNAFLPKKAIEALKTADKMEEDYASFKNSRMKSISAYYEIPLETVENIHTDVLKIKKDFYLNNMDSFLKETKEDKNV